MYDNTWVMGFSGGLPSFSVHSDNRDDFVLTCALVVDELQTGVDNLADMAERPSATSAWSSRDAAIMTLRAWVL